MIDIAKPFDRKLVRKHRDRAARMTNFDDFLEVEVSDRVADRLLDIKRKFSSVLVLGCKTGALTRQIQAHLPEAEITQCDLSAHMANFAAVKTGLPAQVVDEEFLPFDANSFDLVISSLSLHWVNDLPGTLLQIANLLQDDGLFLASLLGGGTLGNIRQAFLEAEAEVSDGVRPRFSPVLDLKDAAGLLQRAGMALPVADVDRIEVSYGSALKLLQDLRGMGETSALDQGQKSFTRRETMMRALAKVEELKNENEGRIPVLFETLFLTGWKPDQSQQIPLRPGSAKSRLADFLGSEEVILKDNGKPN
jgi:NADH dehydrogenase [ubiquinone] 1 alpha subcomplex assembly factor 5